ncbi:HAMP domain-containing histidine kinase [bacterium]|nr:HAMP domain-containing histidine kinase [bacterium]
MPPSPIPPLLPWLTLACSLALAVAAIAPVAPPQISSALWAGLCATYLVAEMIAPALNGFGRFPLSAPAFLVLVSCAGSGRGGWLVLAMAGSVIRWVRLRLRQEPWLTGAADALPELWAGALVSMAAKSLNLAWLPWLGALGYLVGWQLPAPLFSSPTARQRALAAVGFVAILGAAVASALSSQPLAMGALLVGALLLGIPIHSQMDALQSAGLQMQQSEHAQTRAHELAMLEQRAEQIDAQQLDAQLQMRCLSVVGELFQETSRVQNPAHLRSSLLNSVRNLIPCDWVGLFKVDQPVCIATTSLGDQSLQPAQPTVTQLAPDRARPSVAQVGAIQQLGAQFSDRGLIVVRRQQPAFEPAHVELLQRLTLHLPVCLAAISYHETQARALGGEQSRRGELSRLANRLTATLDLLARLVGCHGVEELVITAQSCLPELIPQYQAEVVWRGKTYKPTGGLSLAKPAQEERWTLGREASGDLRLFSCVGQPLSDLDRELLRLFSSQFACLLETAELHDDLRHTLEQLKQSQTQLVQASKLAAIGQLAAGVAHELNTPLGTLTVGCELIKETLNASSPSRALSRIDNMLAAATRMQEIISKLLLYSADTGSYIHPLELNKLIQDTLCAIEHPATQIHFKPGPPCTVRANSQEMQQIIRNLVLNAMDCQSPEVELWLESRDGQAALHVKDHGIGMDEATSSRVYDPFFSTKKIGEGVGLGLSTSAKLVERHGGTLTHISAVGEGTTFTVTLPLIS